MFHVELKRIRLLGGFTQKAMAEHLGLAPSTYKSWERGMCLPCLENLALLMRVYPDAAGRLRQLYILRKL